MNERENLLKQVASYGFAAFELNLFLDTHPNNTAMKKTLEDYLAKYNQYTELYESKYGPIRASDTTSNKWSWISEPWPWEIIKGGE